MRYIVLLGAPGSGKGTQANPLGRAIGLPAISTGDLFREHRSNGTELGQLADSYMKRGELVPDDVTIAMVNDRLAQPDASAGAILDGFPRTIAQGEALDRALAGRGEQVNQAILLEVDTEELLRRLSGRWICRNCQTAFHQVFNPPAIAGRCDKCGGELFQRPDDSRETAERRLMVYEEQTAPLIAYYQRQGKLVEVPGVGTIEQIAENLRRAAIEGVVA